MGAQRAQREAADAERDEERRAVDGDARELLERLRLRRHRRVRDSPEERKHLLLGVEALGEECRADKEQEIGEEREEGDVDGLAGAGRAEGPAAHDVRGVRQLCAALCNLLRRARAIFCAATT